MNTVLISILLDLGYVLIFPGFLFCFLVGMLLCGIERKIVARMQKRVGPPVLQPFYDFFKLCGKETIIPAVANKAVYLVSPIIGLASLVILQLFIPIFSFSAFSNMADVIVILYLLLIPALAEIFGAASTGSPYAGIGLSREMVTIISCELPLILIFLAVGKYVGNFMEEGITFSIGAIRDFQLQNGCLIGKLSLIPAAIAMLMVIPGEIGSKPFDIAEAETEICEGMLAEYSGPPLAVYKLTHSIKMLTMSSLFVALFLGGLSVGNVLIDTVIIIALCVVVIIADVALVNASTARLKVEQLFKYYWTTVSALALVSFVLAWFGL